MDSLFLLQSTVVIVMSSGVSRFMSNPRLKTLLPTFVSFFVAEHSDCTWTSLPRSMKGKRQFDSQVLSDGDELIYTHEGHFVLVSFDGVL